MQQTGISVDQKTGETKGKKNRNQYNAYGQEWHTNFMSNVTINDHVKSDSRPKIVMIGITHDQFIMHRPENTINQRLYLILTCAMLWSANPASAADDRFSGFSAGDTVSIQADNAWEDVAPDTIHFSGHFELKAQDWYLSADQATLRGNLDDPETATLTGSPANIQLETVSNNRIETITGKADRIVYQRITNSISLEGEASISRAGQTMQSEEIEYDIDQDRILAGGSQGVRIRVKPEG
jgi:lipopolysaccharide transport protein LptA